MAFVTYDERNLDMRISLLAVGLAVANVATQACALPAQPFDVLFRVTEIRGTCQVQKPDAAAFEPAVNGKAYPFGTRVRTGSDSKAVILLSPQDGLQMQSLCSLTVRQPADAETNRLVQVDSGKVVLSVRAGLPEKALTVETAVAACDSFVGRGEVQLIREKDALRMDVSTGNGALRVVGPQFTIPKMKGGGAARIVSSLDRSITRIVNAGSEYKVDIDNGTDAPITLDSSTKGTIRIWREHAPVGKKLVVSVFASSPDGKGKENFAYVLGEPMLTASGLPIAADESSGTGGVSRVGTPAGTSVSQTNTVKGVESLF